MSARSDSNEVSTCLGGGNVDIRSGGGNVGVCSDSSDAGAHLDNKTFRELTKV